MLKKKKFNTKMMPEEKNWGELSFPLSHHFSYCTSERCCYRADSLISPFSPEVFVFKISAI